MARNSLGSLVLDLALLTAHFETDIGRAARLTEKRAQEMQKAAAAAGKAIGVSLAAGVTTAGYALKKTIDDMDNMSKAAQRVGMSTEAFSQLAYAGDLADVSMEDLQGSLGKLVKGMGDAQRSTSVQAKLFKAMGIEVTDASGKLRGAKDVLYDFADAFQKQEGSPEIIAAGMNIFGRSFQKIIPLIKDGSEGLRDMAGEADALGVTLGTITGQQAEAFNDNLRKLQIAAGGLAMQVASDLLPDLESLTNQFTDMVARGGDAESMAHNIADGFRAMASAAESSITLVSGVAEVVGGLVTQLGGFYDIAASLATFDWERRDRGAQTYRAGGAQINKGADRLIDPHGPNGLFNGKGMGVLKPATGVYTGPLLTPSKSVEDAKVLEAAAEIKRQREFAKRVRDALGDADTRQDATDKAVNAQLASQKRYREEIERLQAELVGPLRVAEIEHDQRIRALTADLKAHNITQADFNAAKALADQKLQATTEKLRQQGDILAQIQTDYAEQIRLSGLSAEQYRIESEMIRRRNDAKAAGVTITEDMEAAWRREIALGEHQLAIADAAKQAAEDYQQSWLNAVQSVGNAIGDFMTRQLHSWKDFGHSLVSIAQRWGSDVIAKGFTRLLNGGFADAGGAAGASGGGWLAQLIGGSAVAQKVAGWFGFGGGSAAAPAASGAGWATAYGAQRAAGVGVLMPQFYGAGTMLTGGGAAGGGGYGGSLLSAATAFKDGTLGKFLTSPAAPWLGAAAGALYGWNKGGDTAGKALGAAAYGTAAWAGGTVLSGAILGGAASSAAGAGVAAGAASGAAGAAAAIPVVGWIALAAIAIDKLSGGKLFGTKYKVESAQTNYAYGDAGIGGSTEITKVRNQSLFRGRKWTTDTQALSDEARQALDDAFGAIDDAVTQAAGQLGISAPALLGAQFAQEFDAKGNLKREFGTIAGRVYREAQDAFNTRYLAENLLNVAGLAGGHATAIDQLANGYRGTPEALTDFATTMLAIAGDAKAGKLLWDDTDEALKKAIGTLGGLERAGESLAQTYQRVSEGIHSYADLIGGVRAELLTHGLSEYAAAQVQIEQQYRDQVKQANDLAKALGLSGARAEDLASIELLRAQRMGDLQRQMDQQRDQFLGGLRLSDLAPGTDASKLQDARGQFQDAIAAGNLQQAQQLAQSVLGFGRNLYASGSDYNALYGQVTGMLGGLDPAASGLASDALNEIAGTLDTLPEDIASAFFGLISGTVTAPQPPAPIRDPADHPHRRNPKLDNPDSDVLDRIAQSTATAADAALETLRLTRRRAVVGAA